MNYTLGKKPYKGKFRNRKGKKKESGLGITIDAKRLRPKPSSKKGTIKQRADSATREPLNPNRPIRFGFEKYWQRVIWIQEIGACQICGIERDLDHPHHVSSGAKKDDRYMINACTICHSHIHVISGYDGLEKSFDDCLEISWANHLMCEIKEKDLL